VAKYIFNNNYTSLYEERLIRCVEESFLLPDLEVQLLLLLLGDEVVLSFQRLRLGKVGVGVEGLAILYAAAEGFFSVLPQYLLLYQLLLLSLLLLPF
jgi:hypothetical protein